MRRKQRIAETTIDSFNGFHFYRFFTKKGSYKKCIFIKLVVTYIFYDALILEFKLYLFRIF